MDVEITIRPARPSDARYLAAFDKRLARESDIDIPIATDEVHTAEDYEDRIRRIGTPPNTTYLVAIAQGTIIGTLSCYSGRLKAFTHAVTLGVSVDKDWRGKGIGTKLMNSAIDWARAQQLKRIELRVYARNEGAIRLYKQLGFEVEGTLRKAIKHNDEYLDELVMALLL